MKIIVMTFILALFAGCDAETTDDTNHGFGFDVDFVTDLGIGYRDDSGSSALTAFEIDDQFTTLADCSDAGTSNHQLMIIITDDISALTTAPNQTGVFLNTPNLIVLEEQSLHSDLVHALRAELLHYLAYFLTGNADLLQCKPPMMPPR
ncbi:MAG: hypothetical protein OEY11_14525 [Gammaproteobacteria bacterium]|nr:hypothetical protein [Gammaproteobacteria bacterium]